MVLAVKLRPFKLILVEYELDDTGNSTDGEN
jgi:hypothetical protein